LKAAVARKLRAIRIWLRRLFAQTFEHVFRGTPGPAE
jgi:hypothetical protein